LHYLEKDENHNTFAARVAPPMEEQAPLMGEQQKVGVSYARSCAQLPCDRQQHTIRGIG